MRLNTRFILPIIALSISAISFQNCQSKRNTAAKVEMSELVYDDSTGCFEGDITIDSVRQSITLCDYEQDQSDTANAYGHQVRKWLELNFQKAKDFATKKLLPLKNKTWLRQKEKPLTHDEFLATLYFEGINAYGEGGFEIFFTCGDLFYDHFIMITVSEKFELEDADIVG